MDASVEIQELLAQSEGELSDIDDPDFENIPESDTDSENLENDSLVYEEIEQSSTSKVGQKRIRTKWDNSEFMNFNLDGLPLEFRDTGFQGLAILDYLVSRNIYLTGTVMTNRTDGVAGSFPKDTYMERGSSVSRRREDGKACLVKWKDKKSVLLLSSTFGIKSEGSCKRWAKEQRQRVDV
ncbi:piggyBac transposable element-derived protein 3 [Trichonephila clavipes]|nr:piggyBac transposable element-derived protein 3 [Trichonephila clavipes]